MGPRLLGVPSFGTAMPVKRLQPESLDSMMSSASGGERMSLEDYISGMVMVDTLW